VCRLGKYRLLRHPGCGESARYRGGRQSPLSPSARLAIDIYRPEAGGKPVDKKLPVILVATPFHRSSETNGEILTFLAPQGNHRNVWDEVLKHGYVIASLDIRGRGVSFGTRGLRGYDPVNFYQLQGK
jgi:hypothetical protein